MTTRLERLAVRYRQPWLPCPDATSLNVWNEFGAPAMGTFETPNGPVLFYSVDADLMPSEYEDEMWTYLPLSGAEYEELCANRYININTMADDFIKRMNGRSVLIAWSVLGVIQAHKDYESEEDLITKIESFRRDLKMLSRSGQLTISVYIPQEDNSDELEENPTNNDLVQVDAGDLVFA